MEPINVAVLGAGGIAAQHGRALAEHPGARITAAVDASADRREVFAIVELS